MQQSWSRGGGKHHFNRQQQQQQLRLPPKPLTANFGLGGPFNGGTNARGWPQEELPPSPNGSVPHCEQCGRKGHVARTCRTPPRFEGICGTCGQYGHRMRYCIRNQPAPHVHVVAAPIAPHSSSVPAFSAPPAGGSGYDIATGAYGHGGGGGGAYGYGGGDGSYSGGAYGYGGSGGGYGDGTYSGGTYDHGGGGSGGNGGASYEVVRVGQSPGGGGAGHDISSRPPEHLMAATMELCSRQAAVEPVSSLRLRTGATRMKGISVVLFPPFSVARNRVMAPLLMSCSF